MSDSFLYFPAPRFLRNVLSVYFTSHVVKRTWFWSQRHLGLKPYSGSSQLVSLRKAPSHSETCFSLAFIG